MSADRNPGVGRAWLGEGVIVRGPLPNTNEVVRPQTVSPLEGTATTNNTAGLADHLTSARLAADIKRETRLAKYSRKRTGRVTGRWGN